jgi:hypothetical protein
MREEVLQQGELEVARLESGELTPAGQVELDLPVADEAYKFTLQVTLRRQGRTINTNNWSFWAFPETPDEWQEMTPAEVPAELAAKGVFLRLDPAKPTAIPENASLVLAGYADAALADYLERGGTCLLFTGGTKIENTVVYYGTRSFYTCFRTIPWNAGTSGNSGSVIHAHAALDAFPHEGRCDLQFIWMVRDVLPMEFSPLRPYGVEPIIRMIDHYAANRNNAHLLEFSLGRGKVLATGLGILPQLHKHIEARHLLYCLGTYAQSRRFQPAAKVPRTAFLDLFSVRPKDKP